MSNVMRVAKTLIHGREAAALAEDAELLRDVREQFNRLAVTVSLARFVVGSDGAKTMLAELEEGLATLNHDACVHSTAEAATEAAQTVGVRLVKVVP